MCLAGDESALTRLELGDATVEPGRSYEFRDTLVREYPSRRAGGRHEDRRGHVRIWRPFGAARFGPGRND